MRNYTVCENKLEMNKLIPVIWCKTCQSLLQLFSTLLEKDWFLEWDVRDEFAFQRFRWGKFQVLRCLCLSTYVPFR